MPVWSLPLKTSAGYAYLSPATLFSYESTGSVGKISIHGDVFLEDSPILITKINEKEFEEKCALTLLDGHGDADAEVV